jgi:hypothetical protein
MEEGELRKALGGESGEPEDLKYSEENEIFKVPKSVFPEIQKMFEVIWGKRSPMNEADCLLRSISKTGCIGVKKTGEKSEANNCPKFKDCTDYKKQFNGRANRIIPLVCMRIEEERLKKFAEQIYEVLKDKI